MTNSSDASRWAFLARDLEAAGFPCKVQEQPTNAGRRHTATFSRSITLRFPEGGMRVEVHDKWLGRYSDTWVGWQVHLEDGESIEVASRPLRTRRSEVVADVRDLVVLGERCS